MPTFTVQRAQQKKTVDGKYGPMQVIDLRFSDGTEAEWFTKASTPLPAPGSTLEGDLEDGQYGKSFKKAKPAGGFSGGGGMSPERQAAVQRQHSQSVAVEYAGVMATLGRLPDGFGPDDLKTLIDWFDRDAMRGLLK